MHQGAIASARFRCIGAAHWDLIARADGPMAPGDDVPGRIRRRPGGVALNLALALAREGMTVTLHAVAGADAEGGSLARAVRAAGVRAAFLRAEGLPTGAYLGIEAGGALLGGVAECRALEAAGATLAARLLAARPGPGETVILDGNLPRPALEALLAPGALRAATVLVPASPAKAARLRGLRAGALYANLAEAAALLGRPPRDSAEAASALADGLGARVLVTDGKRPAALAAPGREPAVATPPPVAAGLGGVTGAGDVLAAAHLAALARGLAPGDALAAALAAAAAHLAREDP